jgi:hypothetical protein
LIKPSDLDPDSFVDGLSLCIDEFNGDFRQNRKPSRTLVRVEEVEKDVVYLVVPGFSQQDVIRIRRGDLPRSIDEIVGKGRTRLHAFVNLGAETEDELFFENWDVP